MPIVVEVNEKKIAGVLPCESDGLGATLFNLAPSKSEILDMPFIGAGQYALVVSGTVSKGDAKLSKNSCVYRYAEDEPLNVVAGVDGARAVSYTHLTLPTILLV